VQRVPSFPSREPLFGSRSRRPAYAPALLAAIWLGLLAAGAVATPAWGVGAEDALGAGAKYAQARRTLGGGARARMASSARKVTAGNWDATAQRTVLRAELMVARGGSFNGAAPLSLAAERSALGGLAQRAGVARVGLGDGGSISVTRFDALLVNQLGLGKVAAAVQRTASAAGLRPPTYFGTEVVARFLGLRYEHPVGQQALDLYPWDPITRAEAAYSFAAALRSAAWAATYAEEAFASFSLPAYTQAQLEPLRIAVSKIGMPYVWGGTTDGTEDGLEHGGYDCSGFAWRVYKLSGLAAGTRILGRTAAEQAGEIPKSERIRLKDVEPGDLLFFGTAHFNSTATASNVIHEGIALSDEWAINSSGQGVYVLPLTSGWLHESFTWARRVL
jgi:cell wall-associated NlpC family hydrolase